MVTMTAEQLDEKIKSEVEAKVADIDAKVDANVDKKLKEIDFPKLLKGAYQTEREVKMFDKTTGKIISVRAVSEVESTFNNMLKALTRRDMLSAQSMSKDIDSQNALDDKILGYKTPTPSRSDSDAVGGYASPTEVDARIMQMVYAQSVMYSLMNKQTIIFDGKMYPLMYGMTVADIADQGTAVTETNAVYTNPTIAVQRAGAWTSISNEFINQKGVDLISAYETAIASGFARFLDLRLAVGNVTGASDLVDGLVFDANTVLDTAVTKENFAFSTMEDQLAAISDECDQASLRWIGNRVVKALIGNMEDTKGGKLFPQYVSGGDFSPLGLPFVLNTKIPSTLDVGGDARTTGTDNVLILADLSKCYTVLDERTRIDLSKDFYFIQDLTTIRGIKRYGSKVMVSTTVSTGGVCRAQEISV